VPLVRIDLSQSWSAETRRQISDGIHSALISALAVPEGDLFQIFTTHAPGDLVFDQTFLGLDRQDVIFVQVLMVRKYPAEAKFAFYKELTANLGKARIRKDDLFISVIENASEDWTAGER
jgi:hypothetical protein